MCFWVMPGFENDPGVAPNEAPRRKLERKPCIFGMRALRLLDLAVTGSSVSQI